MDLLQDLLQEFVPGIRVFIRSLQFKVCVLKPGGPERAPPGASEEAFVRAFSIQDENKVMFFSEFVLGSLFETCFRLFPKIWRPSSSTVGFCAIGRGGEHAGDDGHRFKPWGH